MRRLFIFACASALIATLAACNTGGGSGSALPTLPITNTPPTAVPTLTLPSDLGPSEGTVRPSDVAPIDNPTATIDPTLAATIEAINQAAGTAGAIVGAPTIPPPAVGTIATALPTEDPDVGLLFDEIYFSQTGGGTTLVVQVYPDGRVLRDGQQFSIAQDQVVAMDNILDEINFFGMQGVFTSVGGNPNAYIYELSVSRGEASRNLIAEDGLIPPDLQRLFSLLLDAGLSR